MKASLVVCLALAICSFDVAADTEDGKMRERVVTFDIPAQSLAEALVAFSRQSGSLIIAPSHVTDGIMSSSVSGAMPISEALKTLIGDAHISYTLDADGAVRLGKPDDKAAVKKAPQVLAPRPSAPVSEVLHPDPLEEINVTADKPPELLQDKTSSSVAYDESHLERSGVSDMLNISALAVGTNAGYDFGTVRFAMRGISTPLGGPGTEDGVAFYRDGTFLAKRTDRGLSFYDIEKLELKKGPQGTKSGKNAAGGIVKVTTKAPTQAFEAGASATLGNYGHIATDGFVSGAMGSPKVLGRLAYRTSYNHGYTENSFRGGRVDSTDFAGVRARLRLKPVATVQADFIVDYGRDFGIYAPLFLRRYPNEPLPTEQVSGVLLPEGRAVAYDIKGRNDRKAWGGSAELRWESEGFSLTSMTTYREIDSYFLEDGDGGAANIVYTELNGHAVQYSQEFRINVAKAAAFQWNLGAYYFAVRDSEFWIGTFQDARLYRVDSPVNRADAYALFGEATFSLGENLSVIFGGRLNYEERATKHDVTLSGVSLANVDEKNSWSAFTPLVSLKYDFSDTVSTYATYSQGFKSGGYEARDLNNTFYDDERLTNYEIGLKGSFWGEHLQLGVSAFHMNYHDQQVPVTVFDELLNTLRGPVTNAEKSEIQGVELNFISKPLNRLSVEGGFSFLDARFTKFSNGTFLGEARDATGNRLPEAPKLAFNLAGAYGLPVKGVGYAVLRAEYSYKGKTHFDNYETPEASQKAYGLLNGWLELTTLKARLSVALWAYNLTNVSAYSIKSIGRSGNVGNHIRLYPIAPRTYGLTVSYKF